MVHFYQIKQILYDYYHWVVVTSLLNVPKLQKNEVWQPHFVLPNWPISFIQILFCRLIQRLLKGILFVCHRCIFEIAFYDLNTLPPFHPEEEQHCDQTQLTKFNFDSFKQNLQYMWKSEEMSCSCRCLVKMLRSAILKFGYFANGM